MPLGPPGRLRALTCGAWGEGGVTGIGGGAKHRPGSLGARPSPTWSGS